MYRTFLISLFILGAVTLCAQAEFYPQTLVGEAIVNASNSACQDAFTGIDTLHSHFSTSEFLSARYYDNSGALSNQWANGMIDYYNPSMFPTTVFYGTHIDAGGGTEVADGSQYLSLLEPKRFSASPIKIAITNFNTATGNISARVSMVSSTYAVNNASIRFLLLQDDVEAGVTNVVREVITQNISLAGQNNFVDTSASFVSIPPDGIRGFWGMAYVQLANHSIIQAASSLPQPDYQIRTAVPFNTAIVDSANFNYLSAPMWFTNLGTAETFTIRIVQDGGPAGWYYNFCSEDGLCYPGSIPHPFTLEAGDITGYHLNLIVGESGTSNFHILIQSPNIDPYIIPFTYQTSDTPNQDEVLPRAGLSLLQNFPNPVYDHTTFSIKAIASLPSQTIEIYNCKGERVQSLVTGKLKQGVNELSWDARSADGKQLAPGIYLYKIIGAASVPARKLIVLNNK